MIRYELLAQRLDDSEYGSVLTYGVTVLDHGEIIRSVEDISLDKEKVGALITRFNQERLSPVHLDEAIENFLYDFEV